MSPEELLAREPDSVSNSLEYLVLINHSHIPESGLENWDVRDLSSDRLEVKVYKHYDFDYRRFWRLSSVWLDNEPVMICCNAGREGDDHHQRYLLDKDKYRELVILAKTLAAQRLELDKDIKEVPLTQSLPKMTDFYGNKLDGYFEC
jgi:hypothetical protein